MRYSLAKILTPNNIYNFHNLFIFCNLQLNGAKSNLKTFNLKQNEFDMDSFNLFFYQKFYSHKIWCTYYQTYFALVAKQVINRLKLEIAVYKTLKNLNLAKLGLC